MAHPRFNEHDGNWFAGLLSMSGSLHMNKTSVILTIQSLHAFGTIERAARIIGNDVRHQSKKGRRIDVVEVQGAALHFLITHPWVWDNLPEERKQEYVKLFGLAQSLGYSNKKGRFGRENSHYKRKEEAA